MTARSSEKVLPPVRANAVVEAQLRKRLDTLLAEMHRSAMYWIKVQYRATPPEMAEDDATPADQLRRAMKELSKRWLSRFDDASVDLAEYFAQATQDRSDARLRSILRKAGIAVRFKPTPAQRDILAATVNEATALIKSIPAKYLADVEGAVMRSVQTGRDLGKLSEELQNNYGVAKRRAATIARDQNNKATAAMNRARQVELGITEAIWVHSAAGKTPRPSHAKAGRDKVRYDVRKGWYDPHVGEHILPGQLVNCRCSSRSVIKGLS